MRIKRLSGALVVSIVCHIVVIIIAGFHLVTQDHQFKELLGTEFIVFQDVPKPKVRKPIRQSGIKQMKVAFERPPGLAMVENVGASRYALKTPGQILFDNQSVMLGNVKVPQWHPSLNPPNGEAYNDVFFKGSGTNPFIDTEDDTFSTFGMDVDTAFIYHCSTLPSG